VAVGSPAVRDNDAAGSFVVRSATEQDAVETNRPAFRKRGAEHAGGVPLPSPWCDDVKTDMAASFIGQFAVEFVSDHQRAQVVLARDEPKYRRRHRPPLSHPSPNLDEVLEVLTSRAQPVSVRASQQTVGLLTDEVGRADGRDRPHQAGDLGQGDHAYIVDRASAMGEDGPMPTPPQPLELRAGIVVSATSDGCEVFERDQLLRVPYSSPFRPRAEGVTPGHLVAIATTADGVQVVVWRWFDAVVLEHSAGQVRLWEPMHGEVTAQARRPQRPHPPGSRAYLSAGLPGAEWWVAGAAGDRGEDADVEFDEVLEFYSRHDLWADII
jgi:hypothetical protein